MSVRSYYSAIIRNGRLNAPTYSESQRDLREQLRQTVATTYNVGF